MTQRSVEKRLREHNMGRTRSNRQFRPYDLVAWVELKSSFAPILEDVMKSKDKKHFPKFSNISKNPHLQPKTLDSIKNEGSAKSMELNSFEDPKKELNDFSKNMDSVQNRIWKFIATCSWDCWFDPQVQMVLHLAIDIPKLILEGIPKHIRVVKHPCPWLTESLAPIPMVPYFKRKLDESSDESTYQVSLKRPRTSTWIDETSFYTLLYKNRIIEQSC